MKQLPEYLKNVNLLYVEDDMKVQEEMLKFFSSLFDNLFIANNEEEGLEQFNNNQIDIIITSLNESKSNGIGMLEKIRLLDDSCHIVVILQGNESETLHRCIKLNIDCFLCLELKYLYL